MNNRRFIKSMTTVLSVAGIFLMVYYILKNEYEEDQEYAKMEAVYLESDAVMIMHRAELLLEENNYDEAINQYKIALAMSNDNDEIRQEIARAYKKQCLLTDEGCEKGVESLSGSRSVRWIYSKSKARTESDVRHCGKCKNDSRSESEGLCCNL